MHSDNVITLPMHLQHICELIIFLIIKPFQIHTIYIPFTMFWHKGRLWFHFLTLDTCLISVISAVTKVPDMRTYQNERNMLPNLP
jgi:hypothetical protein